MENMNSASGKEIKSAQSMYQISWEEITALLDKHLGVYEKPSLFDPTTSHTPDGPLMGNGTVLAFLAGKTIGDRDNQTIYISRQDNFEDHMQDIDIHYIGYGGIDIERIDEGKAVGIRFRMEQDMKRSEVKGISERGFQTDTWLSARENIIVSEITNLTEEPMVLQFAVWTNVTDKVLTGGSGVDAGIEQDNGVMYASRRSGSKIYGWAVNSTTAVRFLDKEAAVEQVDAHTCKCIISLDAKESVHMIAAVEGGKGATTDKEDAVEKVKSYNNLPRIAAAKERHHRWWREYWMKCCIDLDEASDSLEKSFYGYLYQIGCAIQAESENSAEGVTAGLFPWTGSSVPDWSGDYTLNTDVQRPTIVATMANRLNHIRNYTRVIKDYWDTAVENASDKKHLSWVVEGSERSEFSEGIRGALYPTHIGPWGCRTEHFNSTKDYFCSPSNGTTVLQPLIQYYKSTLDEAYLSETLYPMVREQANFWVDYAEEEHINGGRQYNIYGATYEETAAEKNATWDLTAAKSMLENAITLSLHLGRDEELREQWKTVHDNLAPFPTKNGYYIEDERGRDPITTSCYNIYGFGYYDLVGPASPQDEKDKILLWLKNKQEFGTDTKEIRAAVMSARVGLDPHVWLDKMKAGYMDCQPDDWNGIRPNNTVGDIGGTLFAQAVMESLMQSHEGMILLFPAWYPEQEASFKNLRAYGAFLVSASQDRNGQVLEAAIHSEKGADCSVLNPWQKNGLPMKVYHDGEEIETRMKTNSLGEVYTFQTAAGADYELKMF